MMPKVPPVPVARRPESRTSPSIRDRVAGGIAAMVVAVVALFAGPAVGAVETVRIALIDPLSGPFAATGQSVTKQFQYVVDLANNRQWAGKDVRFELLTFDGRADPQESVTRLRAAIAEDVHYVVQGSGSAVALALADAIAKYNLRHPEDPVVYLNYGATDPALTNEKCSFWHFRLEPNSDQKMEALTSYLRGQSAVKRVYLINQDYALGRSIAGSARDLLSRKRPDIEIVGDDLHPIGQIRNFSEYIDRIRQSGADTVITGDWGTDLALLVRAAREANLPVTFYTYFANVGGVPQAIGATGEGRIRQITSWTPNERSFTGADLRDDYSKKVGGDFYLKPAYDAIRLLAEGIRKAGTTEPTRVAFAMEGLRFNSLGGEVEMRAADHQLQQAQAITSWQRRDGKSVRFDDDRTGYGWRAESIQPAYVGIQPTSCGMTRPELNGSD